MSLSDLYDMGLVEERIQELIESDKLTNELLWEALGPDAFTGRSKGVEEQMTKSIKEAVRDGDAHMLGELLLPLARGYLETVFAEQAEQDCVDDVYARAEALAERLHG